MLSVAYPPLHLYIIILSFIKTNMDVGEHCIQIGGFHVRDGQGVGMELLVRMFITGWHAMPWELMALVNATLN